MDPRVAKTPYSVYDAVKTRRRTTSAQLKILESVFVDDKKPLASTRKQLAELLHMSHREVQVWFQNR
ncbi:hypothetical protein BV25DRAFT_1803682 [Artomyces pyxidatus]|uniref:Uncharacterized protein n=1 Tax=Artomyces pyxidatus TaxID=48021 RepID=A0ACB8T132_9AGAM|nr:hypothetical protein BV25DRAFT_1803682 [Artomyces pyxidatus]